MSEKKEKETQPQKKPRATAEEIERAKSYIYDLLIAGHSKATIKKELQDEYGYNPRGAQDLLIKTINEFKVENPVELEAKRELYINIYLDVYRKSMSVGDYKTGKSVIDSIAKLEGLLVNNQQIKLVEDFTVSFE